MPGSGKRVALSEGTILLWFQKGKTVQKGCSLLVFAAARGKFVFPLPYELESKEFAKALCLRPAHGNFGVLLVIEAKLVGALEPGDHFFNAIDVHKIGAVGSPKDVRIKAVE
jgi:hypothetical protein